MKREQGEATEDEDFDLCPYCGTANKPGAKKCAKCGEDIEEGDQELY